MKYALTFALLMLTLVAKPCGWSQEEGQFFYNIFDQTAISSEVYYPFLRTDDALFYMDPAYEDWRYDGNIELWNQLLPKWTPEEIKKVLYALRPTEWQRFWDGRNTALEVAAKTYISFALKCGNVFNFRSDRSWDYEELLAQKTVEVGPLLEEGIQLYQAEKNQQLRLRYAYQIVRILHYTQHHQEAVSFFEQKVPPPAQKTEIYYYLIDQLAGCYYSLGERAKAGRLFMEVVLHSRDRKASAYRSFRYCEESLEVSEYLETATDSLDFVLLKSLNGFSDGLAVLKELAEMAPADERVELLFMRTLNDIEREVWPTQIGMQAKDFPHIEPKTQLRIEALDDLAKKLMAAPAVTNISFWQLTSSYLSFLQGRIPEAQKKLDRLNGNQHEAQKQLLARVYEVFSWDNIRTKEEQSLDEMLGDLISQESMEYYDILPSTWQGFILERVGHIYYKNGQLAKAFLVHNNIEELDRIGSLPLLDDLLVFMDKADKNTFEKSLAKRSKTKSTGYEGKVYITYLKGLYYLQQAKPEMALAPLTVKTATGYPLGGYVSAKVFSNNTMECFSCPEEQVMVDSVYLSFAFIKDRFRKYELAAYLIKLDSIAEHATDWKKKLAHYLLGNYYFNVSNTGYYRGLLWERHNCCHGDYAFYEPSSHIAAKDQVTTGKGYNFFGIDRFYTSSFGLQLHAMKHYQQVISHSTNKELNARCYYMMAKCELNDLYNTHGRAELRYREISGKPTEVTLPYKQSFQQLKAAYSDTEFYRQIIKECSFFKTYCSF